MRPVVRGIAKAFRPARRIAAAVVTVGLPMALLVAAVPQSPGLFHRLGGSGAAVAGVGVSPPLGWDSWNTFGCNINQWEVEAQADAMVYSGMRDAGYRYVVVDDCWFDPERGPDRRLRADPVRFPSGMAALGRYLHGLGLRFGIYESPGPMTCAQRAAAYPGRTGSAGQERLDAATFADWGVDYLKYDWCATDSDIDHQLEAFTAMRDAIRATGRPMVYSINPNSDVSGGDTPGSRYDWGGVATMARATQDVLWAWQLDPAGSLAPAVGVSQAITQTGPLGGRGGGGYWNDPDMLVVGVAGQPGTVIPGLTDGEARTQFGMYAMMSAPLIAGNDLTAMSPSVRAILLDSAVLAVDQDPAARPGAPLSAAQSDVWLKRRAVSHGVVSGGVVSGDPPAVAGGADSSTVVAFYNYADGARDFAVPLTRLGVWSGCRVTDLWTGAHWTASDELRQSVPGHDTALLGLRC
jgi:alpha-galactosidase